MTLDRCSNVSLGLACANPENSIRGEGVLTNFVLPRAVRTSLQKQLDPWVQLLLEGIRPKTFKKKIATCDFTREGGLDPLSYPPLPSGSGHDWVLINDYCIIGLNVSCNNDVFKLQHTSKKSFYYILFKYRCIMDQAYLTVDQRHLGSSFE